jgi:hypothetical protein
MESKLKANRTADEAKVGVETHKPYEYQAFPKWVYSPTAEPRLVDSDRELRALKGEWFEDPAKAGARAAQLADEASKAANQPK